MSEYVTVFKKEAPRINQGDIYKDIELIEKLEEKDGFITISKITYPLVVVLTQDCDLEQDYGNKKGKDQKDHDKYLLSVIVAPIYNADFVFNGEHLSLLDYKMQNIKKVSSTKVNFTKNNEVPRYHYLDFLRKVPIPPSIIDFKHFFTVNLEDLEANKQPNYICTISQLFREKVSHRFANYLSRIGLPENIPGK